MEGVWYDGTEAYTGHSMHPEGFIDEFGDGEQFRSYEFWLGRVSDVDWSEVQ